ncbi:hypothetical protein LguiB_002171 [Lonicera macranthoides]
MRQNSKVLEEFDRCYIDPYEEENQSNLEEEDNKQGENQSHNSQEVGESTKQNGTGYKIKETSMVSIKQVFNTLKDGLNGVEKSENHKGKTGDMKGKIMLNASKETEGKSNGKVMENWEGKFLGSQSQSNVICDGINLESMWGEDNINSSNEANLQFENDELDSDEECTKRSS